MEEACAEPFLADELGGGGGGGACQRCVLQNSGAFRSARDNKVWALCLTPTALEGTGSNNKTLLLRLGDVIGAKATTPATININGVLQDGTGTGGGCADDHNHNHNHNQYEGFVHRLEVFAYVPGGNTTEKETGCSASTGLCRRKKRKAAHQTWLVSDVGIAQKWATAINDSLNGIGKDKEEGEGTREDGVDIDIDTGMGQRQGRQGESMPIHRTEQRQRRLLVLINPVSGTGGSRSVWNNTLRPMLEQAQADTKVIFSTRRGEFSEIITNAAAGGDGTNASGAEGASGAAVSASRVGSLDDLDGIVVVGGDGTFFEVLQGMYARADCAAQLKRLSLGLVPSGSGNGLAKTVSVESGEEFGAVSASFLAAKGHTKAMDLLPTESGDKKYLAFLNVGWGMISDVDIESEAYRWVGSFRFTVGTIVRIVNLKHYKGRISFLPALDEAEADAVAAAETAPAVPFRMPSLAESIPSVLPRDKDSGAEQASAERWTSVEGEFVLADATQASHIAHDMPMAPHARLGDGLIDLFFIKKGASRLAMIQMFLAMEKGEHISPRYPCISWFRVRAFRIEPLTSKGRLTVDGELVDYAPLQQHVWHRAANVFCSPE
eukprot:g15404.t1